MINRLVLGTLLLSLLTLRPGRLAGGEVLPANVILFMVDGVRWQEFFHGADPLVDPTMKEPHIFKYLFSRPKRDSFISGDRRNGIESVISNRQMISLPAYQSIMAGKTVACRTNSCGRIETETFPERIQRELNLKKTEVATLASWPMISSAVEHQKGRTFVNTGIQPILEGIIDSNTTALNKKQTETLPSWSDARQDEFTFAQALNYLKNNRPRFLFISLNDSDEWAHSGDYAKYISTLKGYDEKLKILFDTLEHMGDYGQSTSVIFTTDHGRGDGENWKNHGAHYPESKYIWLYGRNPKLGQSVRKAEPPYTGYTHLDIRPTIEKLMGLTPQRCDKCGQVIQELIPQK